VSTRIDEAVDRLEIEALVVRTAWLLDARDWTALADCYTTDGIVDYPYRGITLPPLEWAEHAEVTLSAYEATQHFVGNFVIDLRDDEAHSSAYVLAQHAGAPALAGLLRREDGAPHQRAPRVLLGATWDDDLVRTDRGWRISRRHTEMRWVDSDHVLRHPEESPFAAPSPVQTRAGA
jgi:hypothetical protein